MSDQSNNRIMKLTPDGAASTFATTGLSGPRGLAFDAAGNLYVANTYGTTIERFTPAGVGSVFVSGVNNPQFLAFPVTHPAFFSGEVALNQGVYYLAFPRNNNIFGYYSYLTALADPHYIYHFDLGYEYMFDATDGKGGIYLYDFKSNGFFYTSPSFSFPYLYDFSLNSTLYYYPDPNNPGRYNTNGVRYFYNFSTGKIISK